jgi:hypothetical protein
LLDDHHVGVIYSLAEKLQHHLKALVRLVQEHIALLQLLKNTVFVLQLYRNIALSPLESSADESICTLRFGSRVKSCQLGMAKAAGVPSRLLPVPVWALQAGAFLLGKGDVVQRLCGNLQVDISKARNLLGWVPPVSVEEGLRRAMCQKR